MGPEPAGFESVSETPVAAEVPVARIAVRPEVAALPVGFRNPLAMRVAFVMSLGIMMVDMIPGLNLLFAVWWLAAGWGAVLLYRRLTGAVLSIRAGARLGTLTGILTFLSLIILTAVTMLVGGKELFSEMVKQNPQISPVLDDPAELAGAVLLAVALVFAVVVGVCAAGGALGARFGGRAEVAGKS